MLYICGVTSATNHGSSFNSLDSIPFLNAVTSTIRPMRKLNGWKLCGGCVRYSVWLCSVYECNGVAHHSTVQTNPMPFTISKIPQDIWPLMISVDFHRWFAIPIPPFAILGRLAPRKTPSIQSNNRAACAQDISQKKLQFLIGSFLEICLLISHQRMAIALLFYPFCRHTISIGCITQGCVHLNENKCCRRDATTTATTMRRHNTPTTTAIKRFIWFG